MPSIVMEDKAENAFNLFRFPERNERKKITAKKEMLVKGKGKTKRGVESRDLNSISITNDQ
jgi:hypothetical protein